MQCYSPYTTKDGIPVPCGGCMACRITRTSMWTMRLVHELSTHPLGALFLTLTYAPDYLPPDNSISKRHLQLFIKRLRKATKRPLKYYACGEYGDQFGRPHYHLIVYNLSMDYKKHVTDSWQFGQIKFGTATPESMAYTAGYIQKKLYGDNAKAYEGRQAPFSLMSQGLGLKFAQSESKRLAKQSYLTLKGKKMPIPRYYRDKLGLDPQIFIDLATKQQKDIAEWQASANKISNPYLLKKYLEKTYQGSPTRFDFEKAIEASRETARNFLLSKHLAYKKNNLL